MKDYDIWCEGYRATGESAGATLLGRAAGKTFKEACKNLAETDPEFKSYFNEEHMAYWGCKLYDNEAQARKTYG